MGSLSFTETLRGWFEPLLIAGLAVVGLVLLFLILHRSAVELALRRRRRLTDRYRPLVDAARLGSGAIVPVGDELLAAGRRHPDVIADLLLAPLRTARGGLVDRSRQIARALGLVARWMGDLDSAQFARRATAAHALGLVADPDAVVALVGALDDEDEEVRSATIEALGLIGDPATLSELVRRLPDASRYQRVRLVEALRQFGPAVTPTLVDHALRHVNDKATVAELIGLIGGTGGIEALVPWLSDAQPPVRAAALGAIGTLGLDDRTFYHALRALDDPDPSARAAAARAVGRSRRPQAALYIARRLDDEWAVAASAARALRLLGPAGRAALEQRRDDGGQAGTLARQMLWEMSSTMAVGA